MEVISKVVFPMFTCIVVPLILITKIYAEAQATPGDGADSAQPLSGYGFEWQTSLDLIQDIFAIAFVNSLDTAGQDPEDVSLSKIVRLHMADVKVADSFRSERLGGTGGKSTTGAPSTAAVDQTALDVNAPARSGTGPAMEAMEEIITEITADDSPADVSKALLEKLCERLCFPEEKDAYRAAPAHSECCWTNGSRTDRTTPITNSIIVHAAPDLPPKSSSEIERSGEVITRGMLRGCTVCMSTSQELDSDATLRQLPSAAVLVAYPGGALEPKPRASKDCSNTAVFVHVLRTPKDSLDHLFAGEAASTDAPAAGQLSPITLCTARLYLSSPPTGAFSRTNWADTNWVFQEQVPVPGGVWVIEL